MLKKLLLACATGLLLWLSWPQGGFSSLAFIAFLPLLFLEKSLVNSNAKKPRRALFFYAYLAMVVWQFITIFWLKNASWAGVITVVILNCSLFALVFVLASYIKSKLGEQRGYISLPFLWISAESIHNYWDFSFPWLTMGNVFAEDVKWIQWYDITGAFGGSFWIWMLNLVIFYSLVQFQKTKQIRQITKHFILIILPLFLIPVLFSISKYNRFSAEGEKVTVAVVQPNIDTYVEKFELPESEQIIKFIDLANTVLTDTTDFLVGPETFLPKGVWEHNLESAFAIRRLREVVDAHPQLSIVIGATTRRFYKSPEEKTPTARPLTDGNAFYDAYNSALLIQKGKPIEIYHKSKLVVGVEMMPYENILKPLLGALVKDFGGISGTLGTQEDRTVFKGLDPEIGVAPVICWESDFGEYVGDYVKNDARVIFVMTNDDWWDNTQGHKQHLHHSRLRAIEHRRAVARSANTGISCFINARGDVYKPQPYRTSAAIVENLTLHSNETYYTKAGDVLMRISWFISIFLFLFSLVRSVLMKKQY